MKNKPRCLCYVKSVLFCCRLRVCVFLAWVHAARQVAVCPIRPSYTMRTRATTKQQAVSVDDPDEHEIVHAPQSLLQAALLSPDFLSLLTVQRGAVLTLRSAATCHALLDAATATPDAVWRAACQRWPLVASADWPQSWKATFRQQLLSRQKSPTLTHVKPCPLPLDLSISAADQLDMYEVGIFIHDPKDGRRQVAWSPLTDLDSGHDDGPVVARWQTGFRVYRSDFENSPLSYVVQIRRRTDGRLLTTCPDQVIEDSTGPLWSLFGFWSDDKQQRQLQQPNVQFNVDFVYLLEGLDGESNRLYPDMVGDDELGLAEERTSTWDNTYMELIVWNGWEEDGFASTTADLLKSLASDTLASCWV